MRPNMRPARANLFRLGIILALLSSVPACGQKGDLYLPDETAAPVADDDVAKS